MTSLSAMHSRRASSSMTQKFALIRMAATAAALAVPAALVTAEIDGGVPAATLTALVAFAGVTTGYLLGRPDRAAVKATRRLMLRVADELTQYRAFTRLLRDQGGRIVASTSAAAVVIIEGLNQIEAAVGHLRTLAGTAAAADVDNLRSLAEVMGSRVVNMLGHLQFQDVTQQQIAFLSRLSLILDDHIVHLSHHLSDRRTNERPERFSKMFEAALDDCVMNGQRDDHHAASGLVLREDAVCKLELF